jgi:hypothetical protein
MRRILSVVFLSTILAGCGDLQPLLPGNPISDVAKQAIQQPDPSETSTAAQGRDANSPGGLSTANAQVSATAKTNPDAIFCPSGSWYSPTDKMCVTETQAIGPFTRAMVALCKKYGGGESACEGSRWERKFAVRLRLDGQCPRGAIYDASRAGCIEEGEVYGPFKVRDVDECRRRGGGPACDSMRWVASFLPVRLTGGAANRRLFDFYKLRANYDDVYAEVLNFYPAGRRNGCVAFMSTALRMSGTPVPLSEYIEGDAVSLVTRPFSSFLQNRLGWRKITSANNLQPGDVVLTEDDARYPGYPAHTYMFYGWSNQKAGIGWVIDNQDFIHERNVFGYGTYNFTPFAYALRSPE